MGSALGGGVDGGRFGGVGTIAACVGLALGLVQDDVRALALLEEGSALRKALARGSRGS